MNLLPGLSLQRISSLPMPVVILLGFLGGGSIMGLAWFATGGNKMVVLIIGLGLLFVWLLLMLFKAIIGWSRKRKANPLSQGISGNAAAAPQGISEPARRARLDDLRRNFEQGVEKFRAAGKNLYSVPWYVLVGEPGSGKTEAIRHCNVGFPPGLQDQLQGAGGTLNMNWWFTNQAIILDTAGRLMFEEVAPGSTNEWGEFLKLLKTNRPNCPINGMLLVIPVDTLIKDTADSIEKKAGKIAQQLDQIQRTLGVRFPVFIIISKCDLLNGFREFFDDLNDPQLQHQIMGWSNPAPLDEKFNPNVVINHLDTVKKRLVERRQQLLLDPVNTEDPQGRRVDQVDALYALPDSIVKIGPRLRRYLEMIFQAGEWSPQPLFLRGIYFTSSMTEGSALDAELAEVLGVPLDSLPEGRVWRRDRAYFLRDLFIEKVFREKGLVTRAGNADKQQRTRRTLVLTVGFIAVVVLFALTYLGYRQLDERIGKQRDFWVAADTSINPQYTPIVDTKKNNAYNTDEIAIGAGASKSTTTISKFFGSNLDLLKAKIEVPIMFRPMAFIGGDIDTNRRSAYRSLYESTILLPVYSAARKKIDGASYRDWSDEATGSLIQLMKLEYANATHQHAAVDHPEVEIDPVFHFVLSADDYDAFKQKDEAGLQSAADWIYTADAEGANAWPPAILQPGTPTSLKVVEEGVDTTLKYWVDQSNNTGRMSNIMEVRQALDDFRTAEDALLVLKKTNVDKLDTYHAFLDTWQEQLANLTTARNRALAAWTAAIKDRPESSSLKDLYSAEVERIGNERRKVYETMLALTVDTPGDASKINDSVKTLAAQRVKLQAAIASLDDWKNGADAKAALADITTLDANYLGTIKDGDALRRRFEIAAQFYETADTFQVKKDVESTVTLKGPMTDALGKLDSSVDAADGNINTLLVQTSGPEDRLAQAGEFAKFAIDVGARCHRYLLSESAMASMLKNNSPDAWASYIESLSKSMPQDHLVRPPVPFINADKTFPAKYSPDAVGFVFDSMNAIDALTAPPSDPTKGPRILDVPTISAHSQAVRKYLNDYIATYRSYWESGVFDELRFSSKNWDEFSGGLVNMRENMIRAGLEDYGNAVIYSLNKVGDTAGVTIVKSGMQLAESNNFQKEAIDLISRWRDLGGNAKQARRDILAMDASAFLETYTSGTAKITDGYVARYWQGLPLEAIRVLAIAGRGEIQSGLLELAKYERFPLAPPKATNKEDLTAAELLNARAALEKVKGSAPNALKGGAKTIGDGNSTRDKDVDAQLDMLRGADLLKDKQAYLSAMENFFVALPKKDNAPIVVNMSVMKDKLTGDNSIALKYTYLIISQDGKQLLPAYFGGNNADACDVTYPAGDLVFEFKEVPGGPAIQTSTFGGPWAALHIIDDPANVKSVTKNGNKFDVEYGVKDSKGKVWSLWLEFTFPTEIPDLADWPDPSKTQ